METRKPPIASVWPLTRDLCAFGCLNRRYDPSPDAVSAHVQGGLQSGAARMLPTGLQTLRRASQCALIISHKFLDTFICEFVCDVEALPGQV